MDTFVIRLWSPAEPAATCADDPRGVARHIATGHAAAFRDGAELLALLRELPQRGDNATTAPIDPGRVPA